MNVNMSHHHHSLYKADTVSRILDTLGICMDAKQLVKFLQFSISPHPLGFWACHITVQCHDVYDFTQRIVFIPPPPPSLHFQNNFMVTFACRHSRRMMSLPLLSTCGRPLGNAWSCGGGSHFISLKITPGAKESTFFEMNIRRSLPLSDNTDLWTLFVNRASKSTLVH